MRDDVQVAKIRKIIALLTEQQKDMVASTQSLSPSVYRDEPRLQQEIERIFHGMPVILGRSLSHGHMSGPPSEIRNPDVRSPDAVAA